MADLTQTPANVRIGSDSATKSTVQAGEAISAGMPVYYKSTDSKYYKADANAGVSESNAAGIALTNASINDYFEMQTAGDINLGATLTVGEIYIVSATAGAICPHGDLGSGHYACILGIAKSASLLTLDPQHIGIARA